VRRSLVRERMAPFSRLESLMAYTEDISASWLLLSASLRLQGFIEST
jgi:hypothetical protein